MIDALIRNGDVATDGTGSIVRAEGADALFQRALLCLTVPKGSFLYDRELGVRSGGADLQRTELLFAEALAKYPSTQVSVQGMTDEGVSVRVNISGEGRTEEVRHYGNV